VSWSRSEDFAATVLVVYFPLLAIDLHIGRCLCLFDYSQPEAQLAQVLIRFTAQSASYVVVLLCRPAEHKKEELVVEESLLTRTDHRLLIRVPKTGTAIRLHLQGPHGDCARINLVASKRLNEEKRYRILVEIFLYKSALCLHE
jgi:hypothetical protein